MKIYEYKGFPNPARIRIALGEKNAMDTVQFVSVDVPNGEHRTPAYFHHATPGLGPKLETCQNRDWGEKQRGRAVEGMHYFDKLLREQAYVVGDEFSMADITVFAGLLFSDFVKLEVPRECEALLAWRGKISQRPSVADCG